MKHTLKAVFDDHDRAQQALDTLLASGYTRADTDLTSIPGSRPGIARAGPAPRWRERTGASTARLLSRVLGLPQVRAAPADSGADVPDSHVLTLKTDSDQEAERAVSLVAVLMDLRGELARTGPSHADKGMRCAVHRRAAVPGALQFHAREVDHFFGTHDAGDTIVTGTTYREPTLPEGLWPGLYDVALQAFHAGLSESAAAARLAYRFGHDMHDDERYRNRSWRESDADLKLLWESGDPSRPGWDDSAAAVRLGWDSTSPEIDDDSHYRRHWKTAYPGRAEPSHPKGPSTAGERARGKRNPAAPGSWENFMDALKHGWNRTRIGHELDETDYRLHHAASYPGTNYDDLAPVYRYGHHLRRRAMIRGRSWEDVEGDVRTEWERGHREGKPATWDEMKAALHAGWNHDTT